MTRQTLRVFTVGVVLYSVGLILGSAVAATDTTLADIAQYRQWTRLTPEPVIADVSSFAG